MTARTEPVERERRPLVFRIAPGLRQLLGYKLEWLRHDVVAGVSVAAVALPTAIAYAQIIGLEPVVGLYAAILPLLAYAVFGTSRHLIVNPDAATCAMIGATLTPLAASNPAMLPSLAVVLAVFSGLFCSTGAAVLEALADDLRQRGVKLGLANIRTEVLAVLERTGTMKTIGHDAVFDTLKSSIKAFQVTQSSGNRV